MPDPFRDTPEQSAAGVTRHWLTRTFGGRTLLAGAGLKLLTRAARLVSDASALRVVDTIGDIALVVGAALLVRQLFGDVRGRLLWRVRRKLTVSYLFIGFVPALLIIIFFLVSGLILFFNVSQYVAAARIQTLVEQADFLAASAATGLQGAENRAELVRRLERRQTGAERAYPYASYAIVPSQACAAPSSGASVRATAPDDVLVAGPWRHVDPPRSLPAWIGCRPVNGLVAYTDAATEWGTRKDVPAHVAARGVAWPEDGRFAVVVDVPLTAPLMAKMQADTGIDYGEVSALRAVTIDRVRYECSGFPLAGHSLHENAAGPAADQAAGWKNPFTRPLGWVTFLSYVDWNSGGSCQASVGIRMTLVRLYQLISAAPVDVNTAFLSILALVGVLFLLIQIAAFVMGLSLARSITGSVHELFTGTERVRLGDFSHKIPISSRDQLGELAQSFNSMTRSIADLLQQKAEKERMEQELRIARNIQMSLLPREPVTLPGLAVVAHCEPAREVGGDYYDYMNVGEQRLGLLIADVAGKGTSAALYMAELKGLMLSLSQLHTSPRELLISANTIISRHLDSRSFITITYAIVDVERQTLTYARAGHCPLIYVPGAYAPSRAAQILAPDGLVLGLQIDDGGRRFARLLEEVTMPLGPGDVFLFYTDGLTEAMDGDGNCFGDARLGAIVQEHADAPFDELRDTILREIATFAGPTAQQDDMTMLLLRVEEIGADHRVSSAVLN